MSVTKRASLTPLLPYGFSAFPALSRFSGSQCDGKNGTDAQNQGVIQVFHDQQGGNLGDSVVVSL